MSVESFKRFVKDRPSLASYVSKREKTWQDFYEMYELYGENSEVWNDFVNVSASSTFTIKDLFGMFKDIDVSQIQESINSIQKGIGYVEDIIGSKENVNVSNRNNYEARPMYRYFDY